MIGARATRICDGRILDDINELPDAKAAQNDNKPVSRSHYQVRFTI